MSITRSVRIALAAGALGAICVAQSDTRPGYKFFRQDENWSTFRSFESGADLFDPLKHVRFDERGEYWMSVGGRLEARFEAWDGFGFGATSPGDSDSFTLSRILVHADLHLGPYVRAFAEGISAQSTDRDLPGGRRTLDMDTLDLFQGFVDLGAPLGDGQRLNLRTGRQAFSFGAQRLVSALPWANTMNRWDGFTAQYTNGPWSVNALATWYVPVDKTEFNARDDDLALFGLYATRAPSPGGAGLDAYWLGDTRPDVTVNGTTGDERRHTLGGRGWGPWASRGDWEVEGAYQFGEVRDEDVSAWMLTGVLGWKWPAADGAPRVWGAFDLASGDSSSGGKVGTFHQLYPLGHAHLGYADVVGRQNIASAHIGVSVQLAKSTSVALTALTFHLMDKDDALYGVGGAVSRAGGFQSSRVGEELDVLLKQRIDRHFELYVGYSHFFSGAAISESGTDDDIDFAYVGGSFMF